MKTLLALIRGGFAALWGGSQLDPDARSGGSQLDPDA